MLTFELISVFRLPSGFSLGRECIVLLLLVFGIGCGKSGNLHPVLPTPGVAGKGLAKIQHVVFIIKENRSFDSYFGTFPGADGAISGRTSTGNMVSLRPTPDRLAFDLGHNWKNAHRAINGGKMDSFDLLDNGDLNGVMLSYTQMRQEDIPNYFKYAHNFVLADRMFSSMNGRSFPNHLFTVGAQSGGAINN